MKKDFNFEVTTSQLPEQLHSGVVLSWMPAVCNRFTRGLTAATFMCRFSKQREAANRAAKRPNTRRPNCGCITHAHKKDNAKLFNANMTAHSKLHWQREQKLQNHTRPTWTDLHWTGLLQHYHCIYQLFSLFTRSIIFFNQLINHLIDTMWCDSSTK